MIKTAFNSVHAHVILYPRLSIFITVLLFIQLLVLFISRVPPVSLPIRPSTQTPAAPSECGSGRVYVYELPTMFNEDLVGSCDDLDPWHWQCGVASNGGYGRSAAEYAGTVPESLLPAWYRTNQFSSEIIYHNRMLNYKCRTMEAESATAFYIPFYAGLAVGKYLFSNHTAEERDWHCEMLLKWVHEQPYWKRSNGSDHFIVLGRITWDFRRLTDPEKLWGSSFLNMPLMQNVTRLTIERAPGDYYDVGVPYPIGFHPHSDNDVSQWQSFVRTRNRTSLYSFVGASRGDTKNDFRGFLLSHCRNESDTCRVVDCAVTQCSNGSSAILEAQLASEFCLQPRGDSFTRRSVFDCMVAGSVPVFFWKRTAYDQYEWFLPVEPESYSVFIDYSDVLNGTSIWGVLEGYSKEEVRRMRGRVIDCIPRIVYAKPSAGLENIRDAFDIAVDGVLRRFKERRQIADENGLQL
ncbi:hypothetical protein RJ639_013488 [Escallonia herrerae]|uniref:Exostosin GT47 domain-containing protein n=1 Tax=Escallonia herrerae TaxID=1293975 RepID=A0AA88VFJ4_9ASTE|nr:hypothetical protein RJ639_013488 [Escallonia herrerae]